MWEALIEGGGESAMWVAAIVGVLGVLLKIPKTRRGTKTVVYQIALLIVNAFVWAKNRVVKRKAPKE